MTTKQLIKNILITSTGVAAFSLAVLSPVLGPVLASAAEVNQTNVVEAVQTVDAGAELRGGFSGRSKHVTSGDVSIVKTATGYDLVLADNFFLDGAPDPVIGFGNQGEYDKTSSFTKLEKKEGRQTYRLPEGFVPGNFSEAYIWCEKFSVPLGVAKLS